MKLFEKCARFTRARVAQAAGYYPFFMPIEESYGNQVIIRGEHKVMMGSNNYLGLTHHPKILAAAEAALRRYGSGCTGSRFLNGTLDLHEQLEERLARFLGKEAAVAFSTGYQTNLGIIEALIGKGDHLFVDKLNHASIMDGARLAYGTVYRYPHNDLQTLERQLAHPLRDAGKLIVTDGVFSMDGDMVDLPGLVSLAEFYGADVMVDDAHALGVLGERGGGTAQHFHLEDKVSLIMATFSKALAAIGGVVAGPERREALWRNTGRMQEGLKNLGYDIGKSETPIIPVLIGDLGEMVVLWKALFAAGVFTNPVIPPAVPDHSCRLRISVMATHTNEQIDFVLDTFARVGRLRAAV